MTANDDRLLTDEPNEQHDWRRVKKTAQDAYREIHAGAVTEKAIRRGIREQADDFAALIDAQADSALEVNRREDQKLQAELLELQEKLRLAAASGDTEIVKKLIIQLSVKIHKTSDTQQE